MKCLSISQPFADLVVSGKKTIEIRNWNTHFRGDFFVHAPRKVRTSDAMRLNIPGEFVTGAIIGRARLDDVRRYSTASEFEHDYSMHLASRDFSHARYGFVLSNPRRFETPIPYRGMLGLFNVNTPAVKFTDDQILAEIADEEYRYQWVNRH